MRDPPATRELFFEITFTSKFNVRTWIQSVPKRGSVGSRDASRGLCLKSHETHLEEGQYRNAVASGRT